GAGDARGGGEGVHLHGPLQPGRHGGAVPGPRVRRDGVAAGVEVGRLRAHWAGGAGPGFGAGLPRPRAKGRSRGGCPMSDFAALEWLVRSALGGGLVLLIAWWGMRWVKSPARRQRLGEGGLLAALLLAVLCLAPGWIGIRLPSQAPSPAAA